MKTAREADFTLLEAIMRAQRGSQVDSMSSAEIKKDALLLAKRNPRVFMELATDKDIELRNVANLAFANGYLKLNPQGTAVVRTDNNAKVIDLGFNDNHYAKTALYFKSDEGLTLYKSILKKLK